MTKIEITAVDTAGTVKQIQGIIGGEITEQWGEFTLTTNSSLAKGSIRFITFDWGVSLLEYDITFHDEITLIMDTSKYNPIQFTYCLEGECQHRFENQSVEEIRMLEQFQSVIITGTFGGYNYVYFTKGKKLAINLIQISRKKFLRKRLTGVEALNKKLYEVFYDEDSEKKFAYYGSYNLKLADKISALREIHNEKGMVRVMQIEGMVYEILAMHIAQHENESSNSLPETNLLQRELNLIHELAEKITRNVSYDYTLQRLSYESGLAQAKLQEGFRLLYARTVTEYIRNVRLEAARDYITSTDMSISEVVYAIGFSSRSYFSKIFKNKFGISPSQFQNHVKQNLELEPVS